MPSSPDPRPRGLATFLAVVFGTTWLFQLPAILAQRGVLGGPAGRYAPLVVLGYFVPTIASLILSRRDSGGEGVGELLRQFGARGLTAPWCALALGHSAVLLTSGMMLARRLEGPGVGALFYPPTSAQLAAMLVIPFTEQIPWRGFAYPTLERRWGPLGASVVIGVSWALFHLQKQALLGPGLALGVALWTLVLMTAGTIVFTWFYRRSGSMLVVVVANAGVYLDNSTRALPGSSVPLAVHALAYCAAALVLIIADRTAWRIQAQPAMAQGARAGRGGKRSPAE